MLAATAYAAAVLVPPPAALAAASAALAAAVLVAAVLAPASPAQAAAVLVASARSAPTLLAVAVLECVLAAAAVPPAAAPPPVDTRCAALACRAHAMLLALLQHTLALLGERLGPAGPQLAPPAATAITPAAPAAAAALRLELPVAHLLALHALTRDRAAVLWCCPPLAGLQRSLRLLGTATTHQRAAGPSPAKRSSRKITPTATGLHGRPPLASPAAARMAGDARSSAAASAFAPRAEGTPPGLTPPGELASRLQAAQHSSFWRQHATLFSAINASLDPMRHAICADALAHARRT